ncbi:hypothetical protein ACFYTG_52925 [Streptomyces mirabilis]|uniref:hypothetical protein n=1 Tax=Streptomyces mirabilis TaxID=68239 RepID=UPI0036CBCDF3
MISEPQRRARLRLARHRTVPTRVRARVQDDQREPEPEPQPEPDPEPEARRPWWNRIPWVHVGTVVGALAAIGGLIFTGVATYYGAAVSKDQLNQAREDAQRDAREQALRVSYWVEQEPTKGTVILHFANRSLDPVTNVTMLYSGIGVTTLNEVGAIMLPAVAPCTELSWTLEKRRAHWVSLDSPIVKWARFIDRGGKRWERTSSGLKQTNESSLGGNIFEDPGDPETMKTAVCADTDK